MLSLFVVGWRYLNNLTRQVRKHRGWWASVQAGFGFVFSEITHVIRYLFLSNKSGSDFKFTFDNSYRLANSLDVPIETLSVSRQEYDAFLANCEIPMDYAGGPMDQGGARDQKLIEYFTSLKLIDVQSDDVVVDVASEWSLFPEYVRKTYGATVYRQDLIYKVGVNGEYIGGSAGNIPVEDGFANKIVLHNAIEHFEGFADSEFIEEAWRILAPGGILCITPLFLADKPIVITDPLVNRTGVTWDEDAEIIEIPWLHNRFMRVYSPDSLQQRILSKGSQFNTKFYAYKNISDLSPHSYLYVTLIMQKPDA